MEIIDGVGWSGMFWYKVLANTKKMSWQQMNQNFEMIELISGQATEAVNLAQVAADSALASANAAGVSQTAAAQSAAAANTAKNQAEAANTAVQTAKNVVDTKAQQVSTDATKVAQDRQVVAASQQQVATHAGQVAADKNQVASDRQASESARNTATQKASEASGYALSAQHWAGVAQESAGAVTSVQGKDGTVSLERTDFPWMGNAAEKNVGAGSSDVLGVGTLGLGTNVKGWAVGSTSSTALWFSLGRFSGAASDRAVMYLSAGTQYGSEQPHTTGSAEVQFNIGNGRNLADNINVRTFSLGSTSIEGLRVFQYGAYDFEIWVKLRAYTKVTALFVGNTNSTPPNAVGTASFPTGSIDKSTNILGVHNTYSLFSATQSELDAGTETRDRLFSPLQIEQFMNKRFSRKITITESQTIDRPTEGPMIVVLYGGGGGGGRYQGAIAGSGGATEFLGYEALGGQGGSPSSVGLDGALGPSSGLFVSSYRGSAKRGHGLDLIAGNPGVGGGSAKDGGAGAITVFLIAGGRDLPATISATVGAGGARTTSGTGSYGTNGNDGLIEIYY